MIRFLDTEEEQFGLPQSETQLCREGLAKSMRRVRDSEGTRWYLQGARRPVQIDNESFVRAAKEIFVRIGRRLTEEGGQSS